MVNFHESEIYIIESKKGNNYYIGGTVVNYKRIPHIFRTTYNRYKRGIDNHYYDYYEVVKHDDFTIKQLETCDCKSRRELIERVESVRALYRKQM